MKDIRTNGVLKHEEEKEKEKRDSNIMKVLSFENSDGLQFAIQNISQTSWKFWVFKNSNGLQSAIQKVSLIYQ